MCSDIYDTGAQEIGDQNARIIKQQTGQEK